MTNADMEWCSDIRPQGEEIKNKESHDGKRWWSKIKEDVSLIENVKSKDKEEDNVWIIESFQMFYLICVIFCSNR